MHVALEFAPIMAEDVPGEHGMHSPALKYRPLLHAASHDETLNPQGTHALSLRDAEVTPKPTGQLLAQAVALYALTSPGPAKWEAHHQHKTPSICTQGAEGCTTYIGAIMVPELQGWLGFKECTEQSIMYTSQCASEGDLKVRGHLCSPQAAHLKESPL